MSFTNSERKADGGGVVIVGTGVGRAFGGSQAPTQSRAGKSLTTLWRSREGPVRLAPRAYDKFPAGAGFVLRVSLLKSLVVFQGSILFFGQKRV